MNIEPGLWIFIAFSVLFILSTFIIAIIALVRGTDAKNLANISPVFPNIFPMMNTIPQMTFGSLTVPIYVKDMLMKTTPNHMYKTFLKTPVSKLLQTPEQNLIVNGQFLIINPPFKEDTSTTTFKDASVPSWSATNPETTIFNKGATPVDWGYPPYPYVILSEDRKISQVFRVNDSCGYKCSVMMNVRSGYGGSAVLRVLDNGNRIRSETQLSLDTSQPGQLAFTWTVKDVFFFLHPGTYTLEISGETQTGYQQSAFTDISIIPFLSNQFTIDLPIGYKTIPYLQCVLVSDSTKHVSDFMKSAFLSQYGNCILQNGVASYFVSSITVNTPAFFTVDIMGPLKTMEDVCAIELTLNWIAIGTTS